jgi:hypothetical protein
MLNAKPTILREQHQGGAAGGATAQQTGVQQGNITQRREALMNEWTALRGRCEKLPNWQGELKQHFDRFEGMFQNFWTQFGNQGGNANG